MPHRLPPLPGRQIVAQVIVSAVILVSGIVIGGGGTILALKDRIIPRDHNACPTDQTTSARSQVEGPARRRLDRERWTTDYGLTETQAQQAKETLTNQFTARPTGSGRNSRKAEQAEREKFVLGHERHPDCGAVHPAGMPTSRRMVEHMQRMRPFDPRRGGRGGPRPGLASRSAHGPQRSPRGLAAGTAERPQRPAGRLAARPVQRPRRPSWRLGPRPTQRPQ